MSVQLETGSTASACIYADDTVLLVCDKHESHISLEMYGHFLPTHPAGFNHWMCHFMTHYEKCLLS